MSANEPSATAGVKRKALRSTRRTLLLDSREAEPEPPQVDLSKRGVCYSSGSSSLGLLVGGNNPHQSLLHPRDTGPVDDGWLLAGPRLLQAAGTGHPAHPGVWVNLHSALGSAGPLWRAMNATATGRGRIPPIPHPTLQASAAGQSRASTVHPCGYRGLETEPRFCTGRGHWVAPSPSRAFWEGRLQSPLGGTTLQRSFSLNKAGPGPAWPGQGRCCLVSAALWMTWVSSSAKINTWLDWWGARRSHNTQRVPSPAWTERPHSVMGAGAAAELLFPPVAGEGSRAWTVHLCRRVDGATLAIMCIPNL